MLEVRGGNRKGEVWVSVKQEPDTKAPWAFVKVTITPLALVP